MKLLFPLLIALFGAVHAAAEVESFSLVDAVTGDPIPGYERVTRSLRLHLPSSSPRALALRANLVAAPGSTVVHFTTSGGSVTTDAEPPYTVALPLAPGRQRMTVSEYSGGAGGADHVSSRAIQIRGIEDPPTIKGITMIDSAKDRRVRGNFMKRRRAINLQARGITEVTFRAEVGRSAFSRIEFHLNGTLLGSDTAPPFSAFGEDGRNYSGAPLAPGRYELEVRGYTATSTEIAARYTTSFLVGEDLPATPTTAPRAPIDRSPAGIKAAWEAMMAEYGARYCTTLLEGRYPTTDEELASLYYDAEWVFYQVADYTGDQQYHGCAQRAGAVYRAYLRRAGSAKVPGFWNFSRGLREEYLRTGNTEARDMVVALSQNAMFASDLEEADATKSHVRSRETAYAILSYLDAEDVGASRRPRLALLTEHAVGHMDQWMSGGPVIRSFMVGLTAQALIRVHERTQDPLLLTRIAQMLDRLWEVNWDASGEAFRYQSRRNADGGTEPAPDLNLLIAPAYEWVYQQTGEIRFRERGDQIFAGGVAGAYLERPKQFNQNYRWSFDYVRWRYGS